MKNVHQFYQKYFLFEKQGRRRTQKVSNYVWKVWRLRRRCRILLSAKYRAGKFFFSIIFIHNVQNMKDFIHVGSHESWQVDPKIHNNIKIKITIKSKSYAKTVVFWPKFLEFVQNTLGKKSFVAILNSI